MSASAGFVGNWRCCWHFARPISRVFVVALCLVANLYVCKKNGDGPHVKKKVWRVSLSYLFIDDKVWEHWPTVMNLAISIVEKFHRHAFVGLLFSLRHAVLLFIEVAWNEKFKLHIPVCSFKWMFMTSFWTPNKEGIICNNHIKSELGWIKTCQESNYYFAITLTLNVNQDHWNRYMQV